MKLSRRELLTAGAASIAVGISESGSAAAEVFAPQSASGVYMDMMGLPDLPAARGRPAVACLLASSVA